MQLPLYQVDAFAEHLFEGNPAAVCPLEKWLSDEVMQSIAQENNLSETAFFVPRADAPAEYDLRWFTPNAEVKLCGHATLATAHVLFTDFKVEQQTLRFHTQSGELSVSKEGEELMMDFPSQDPAHCAMPDGIAEAFSEQPIESLEFEDLLLVFSDEEQVRRARPNMQTLASLPYRGVIITAESADYDFVSRFFAPAVGIDEDPVTGSAHTRLAPYWGRKLGKRVLKARQLSGRGGNVGMELCGQRVILRGSAVSYMQGMIEFS